jgi:sugar phosphate isomerase/epimerase
MTNALSRRDFLAAAVASAGAWALPKSVHSQEAAPPFGLGTVTYNVSKDWDLATLLRILPQAGIEALEFRTTHAHGVEPTLSAVARADVRRRCADAGFRQLSLGTACEFHSPNPAVVDQNIATCAEFVELAKDIGALGVKVRPNGLPEGVPVERTLEQIGKALRRCGDIAGDHGVEIWVEVHGRGTQQPAHMRTIMDHCGHPRVGINWNSNPTEVENGSIQESFDLLKPFLKTVHINDLDSGYPYRELFGLLRDAGFRRYTLVEFATPVPPEDGLEFYRNYRRRWRELARQ